MEYSNLFVCLMGLCTVFIGLFCLIVLVSLMSFFTQGIDKKKNTRVAGNISPALNDQAGLVAAILAAIADDMKACHIISIKNVRSSL